MQAEPSSAPIIQIEDVCFSYRKREILHNVNIAVPPNSMTAILGPNGGGKTTLLKLILGLLKPDRGSIKLFGAAPSQNRTRVGYVPQYLNADQQFPINAAEVVRLGLIGKNKDKRKSTKSKIAEALAQTAADHLAASNFFSLSGGEKQRVLIARALVSDPDILLLDEPTANVDPRSEHELYQLFQTLKSQKPIVFVSHNLNVVSKGVTHVICVNRTAALHAIGEVAETTFTELYGGELTVIHHDQSCHILDSSHAMNQPHGSHPSGCSCEHHTH